MPRPGGECTSTSTRAQPITRPTSCAAAPSAAPPRQPPHRFRKASPRAEPSSSKAESSMLASEVVSGASAALAQRSALSMSEVMVLRGSVSLRAMRRACRWGVGWWGLRWGWRAGCGSLSCCSELALQLRSRPEPHTSCMQCPPAWPWQTPPLGAQEGKTREQGGPRRGKQGAAPRAPAAQACNKQGGLT